MQNVTAEKIYTYIILNEREARNQTYIPSTGKEKLIITANIPEHVQQQDCLAPKNRPEILEHQDLGRSNHSLKKNKIKKHFLTGIEFSLKNEKEKRGTT